MTTLATPTPKTKYPRAAALDVARAMVKALQPACSRLLIAGSLRRRKAEVGDVEVLYIPEIVPRPDPADLFGKPIATNAADAALADLLALGVIEKRENSLGRTAWGAQNKLARHVASGIPIDFFAATPENWWNLVVCRTGGAETNVAICNGAIDAGWKWNPYGHGFSRPNPERPGWLLIREMHSEQEVFAWAGLDYLEPWERA
jgi:DNA polymerase/3'-5' exonuclease PolX